MRQIILDTETTGLSPKAGHRVIEIGAIEMIDRQLTGAHYHVYLNPERPVDPGAQQVHGLSDEFLQDKPLFTEIVVDFLTFINGAELIIHNAPFDIGFINHELQLLSADTLPIDEQCAVLDTLVLARKKHPGQANSLDALCKRYQVNHKQRDLHGALLDSELLAAVYLAMTSEQHSLFDDKNTPVPQAKSSGSKAAADCSALTVTKATKQELAAHEAFVSAMHGGDD